MTMNSIDEIKKRLAYAENNNLFQAHYINDMKFLIKKNKSHLEACCKLTEAIELKDQAIINVSVELIKFMKLTFDPDEIEYNKLKFLIEKVISIPGLELPVKV